MSKYNSKKVTIDGIDFDSKTEGDYYLYLCDLLRKDEIVGFEIQPKYTLIPKFEKDGKHYREITYTPDFLVKYHSDRIVVVDIKGFSTQQGEMRAKMFNYFYPHIKLVWLTYVKKYGGWVEYNDLKKLRRANKKKEDE